jgi:hypothetical protein
LCRRRNFAAAHRTRLHPPVFLLHFVVEDGWETQKSNDSDSRTIARSMTMAMIVFAAAFGLHGIDHLGWEWTHLRPRS